MGEYYSWVNIDKREYLSPGDFGLGSKLYESAGEGNPCLGALYALLASDWKGDAIVFLGDETDISEKETNPVLRRLSAERQAWGEPGVDADYVWEKYRCVSGLFRAAEEEVRREIDWMVQNDDFAGDRYGVDPRAPYAGLFLRETVLCRYTINLTKKEFYNTEKTRVLYRDAAGAPVRINPLSLLMAFPGFPEDACTGLWLGDAIAVSAEKPPAGYRNMSSVYE